MATGTLTGGAIVPSRYHPLYDGVWNDDAFDATDQLPAAPFEERAFFVFLFANHRQRPSGIYRVTDQQLAVDTDLDLGIVRSYLVSLATRRRIVRDGSWLFVRGYLARQPNHANMLKAARVTVDECSSEPILMAFSARYPHLKGWVVDRLATLRGPAPLMDTASLHIQALTQPSANGHPMVNQPINEFRPQSSTEQSSTEQSRAVNGLASPEVRKPTKDELLDLLARQAGVTREQLASKTADLAKRMRPGQRPA